MSKLIIRYPNNVIKEAEFDQPKYRIGSAPDNDLVLENEEVQAHQAEIDTVEGAFSIVDVSENKSTTVNGKKIERVNLNYGDRISFGPVVGLFYPSKKEAVKAKTKLFLFFAAGGIVLVLSIGFTLYFFTRRVATSVTEQMGGIVVQREVQRAEQRRGRAEARKERQARERAAARRRKEAAEEAPGEGVSAEEGARTLETRGLTLPEPTLEEIRTRNAVAVPRGIRGLFFRKIPVPVVETAAPEGITDRSETASAPTGTEEESAGSGTEIARGEAGVGLSQGEESTAEGEGAAPAKRGFFGRAFSPVARLFGLERGKAESGEEQLLEEGTASEGGAETTAGTRPGGEGTGPAAESAAPQAAAAEGTTRDLARDIVRAMEPLAAMGVFDIPAPGSARPDEKPVYSTSELMSFREQSLPGGMKLTELEDLNVSVIWDYQPGASASVTPAGGGLESAGMGAVVVRTGAVGRIAGGRRRGFVYGTSGGVLIGLGGSDGRELFNRDIGKEHGGPFFEPILIDLNGDGEDEIVAAFEKGFLAGYGRNLERIWLYEGKGRITALPLAMDVSGDGVPDLVFTTLGMDLVAVDGKTGFELWRFFDATGETLGSPSGLRINDDSTHDVVFATVDGFLYGVDGKTGWGLWKARLQGRPAGGPAVGPIGGGRDDAVVTLTRGGMLSAHDRGGKQLFTYDMKSGFTAGPSLGDVDGDGTLEIVTIDTQGAVRAVEGRSRRDKWIFRSEAGTTMGRVALADVNGDGGMDALFVTLSGLLTVLDGKSGALLARRNIRDFSFATPLAADLNGDGKLEIVAAGRRGGIGAVQVTPAGTKLLSFRKSSWASVNRNGMNTGYSRFSFLDRGK